jgi:hypothetical protein
MGNGYGKTGECDGLGKVSVGGMSPFSRIRTQILKA